VIRVNTKPRHKNAPRIAEKSAPAFLQWLRGRQCLTISQRSCFGRTECRGKIEAAHVDYAGDKGMGSKVSDRFAIPLCAGHHAEQHTRGWPEFERRYLREGQALKAADYFWRAWPGRIAWERKLNDV
jgi:hypothetical protein